MSVSKQAEDRLLAETFKGFTVDVSGNPASIDVLKELWNLSAIESWEAKTA